MCGISWKIVVILSIASCNWIILTWCHFILPFKRLTDTHASFVRRITSAETKSLKGNWVHDSLSGSVALLSNKRRYRLLSQRHDNNHELTSISLWPLALPMLNVSHWSGVAVWRLASLVPALSAKSAGISIATSLWFMDQKHSWNCNPMPQVSLPLHCSVLFQSLRHLGEMWKCLFVYQWSFDNFDSVADAA